LPSEGKGHRFDSYRVRHFSGQSRTKLGTNSTCCWVISPDCSAGLIGNVAELRPFLLRKLTDADPGIEALTHDIFAASVSDKLDRYVGIGAQELRKFRPKQGIGCVLRRRNPDAAGRTVPQFRQRRQTSLDL
jgi:hypothetical protein